MWQGSGSIEYSAGMINKKFCTLPGIAVVLAAAIGLYAEMMMVRLHSSYFQVFAYFKNISLLSCFLGLGIGYATSTKPVSIIRMVGGFFLQIALLFFLSRAALAQLLQNPVPELFSFGLEEGVHVAGAMWPLLFLCGVFFVNAACFILPGRLAAQTMRGFAPLAGYGYNLVGSILGIVLFTVLSVLQTSPAVWVTIFCIGAGCFMVPRSWRAWVVFLAVCGSMIGMLSVPAHPGSVVVYSPYQRLALVQEPEFRVLETSHIFYQRLLDLRETSVRNHPGLRQWQAYYMLPYSLKPGPSRVLIIGSGTGNDIAAALRAHAGSIDAVEIDPAIASIGLRYHPEQPYQNTRVHTIITDGRAYVSRTRNRYDTIVYGLLDAHSLLAPGASGVRLDSFIYTREGVRQARKILASGGILCMSFCILRPELGRKLYALLSDAFDGRPPVVYQNGYDYSVTFVAGARPLTAPSAFKDVTFLYREGVSAQDIPRDDWPFLYMMGRRYPVSYFFIIIFLAGISWIMIRNFVPAGLRAFSPVPFFLGAGFMLIETKAITEWAVLFGSTWQVVAVAVTLVMLAVFCANEWVIRWQVPWLEKAVYKAIFVMLIAGWLFSFMPNSAYAVGFKIVITAGILFFSGAAFSCVAARIGVQEALASNILGAMAGGFLEYNVMFCGFRALYIVAAILYIFAYNGVYYKTRGACA